MITQARLKELLSYDEKSGWMTWRVGRSGTAGVGSRAGGRKKDGYRNLRIDGVLYQEHRLIWLYVYGYFPENQIDHVNRIRHDNWIENLREVSRQCNLRNIGNPKTNTSGIKGISLHKATGKWRATIRVNGQIYHLGLHTSFTEAVAHRLAGEEFEGFDTMMKESPAYLYMQSHIKRPDPLGDLLRKAA